MRFICVLLAALSLGGCASYRNRPVQPDSNYWPINKQIPQSGEQANG